MPFKDCNSQHPITKYDHYRHWLLKASDLTHMLQRPTNKTDDTVCQTLVGRDGNHKLNVGERKILKFLTIFTLSPRRPKCTNSCKALSTQNWRNCGQLSFHQFRNENSGEKKLQNRIMWSMCRGCLQHDVSNFNSTHLHHFLCDYCVFFI